MSSHVIQRIFGRSAATSVVDATRMKKLVASALMRSRRNRLLARPRGKFMVEVSSAANMIGPNGGYYILTRRRRSNNHASVVKHCSGNDSGVDHLVARNSGGEETQHSDFSFGRCGLGRVRL